MSGIESVFDLSFFSPGGWWNPSVVHRTGLPFVLSAGRGHWVQCLRDLFPAYCHYLCTLCRSARFLRYTQQKWNFGRSSNSRRNYEIEMLILRESGSGVTWPGTPWSALLLQWPPESLSRGNATADAGASVRNTEALQRPATSPVPPETISCPISCHRGERIRDLRSFRFLRFREFAELI